MDTKLKNFNDNKLRKKNIFTGVIVVIMLILSFTMIFRYHYIENRLKEDVANPFESENYASNIIDSNYYLYYKSTQVKNNTFNKPADVFLSEETINALVNSVDIDYYSGKLDYQGVKESFNKGFEDLNSFLVDSKGNIKYYCVNPNTGQFIGNFDFKSDMKTLDDYKNNKNRNSTEFSEFEKNVKDRFLNYLALEYNQDGQVKVVYSYGINKNTISNFFLDIEAKKKIVEMSDNDNISDFSNYRVNPIKNARFIYAIPKNINSNFYTSTDSVSDYINKHERKSYAVIENIGRMIIFSILIITIFMPSYKLRNFRGIYSIFELPFEIVLGIILYLDYSLISNSIPIKIVRETITGNLLKIIIENDISLNISKQLVNIMNLGYSFLVFLLPFLFTTWVKMIFSFGLKEYLKKKSLIIRLIRFVFIEISKAITKLIRVDFRKENYRLCLIGVICVGLVFVGALLANYIDTMIWLIYMLISGFLLLIFVKIIVGQIKGHYEDYNKLLKLTKEIADSDMDVDISKEDIGVYNEIKMQLGSIQQAYKKSVEEEVKSQKMKTELISNISHDLKTPLTSIITYTDLLKDIETNDVAKGYIDTIYRKSERLKILIDDMFEISKAQTGNISLDLNLIDVVALMKQSIFELEDRINDREIILITSFPSEKVILNLDGEKTYRIFENLIVNMAKYAMKGTRAYIDILDEDDTVTIIFRNISATQINYKAEDITDRFKRGDESRNTEGSGLGLSITKSYINVQGGKLEIFLDGDLFKATIVFDRKMME